MKQFEYDPERLIEEVKKRPGIWNYNDPNYKSMATRYELWNELVHELLQPDDANITKSEVRELVLQLQKKWKSLKDAFTKYMQNPYKCRRPYIYHKQLQFLVNKNETLDFNSFEEGQSETEVSKVKPQKRKTVAVKNESSSDEDSDGNKYDSAQYIDVEPDYSIDYSGPSSAKKPKGFKPEIAFASVNTLPKDDVDDCDRMFLLSLLPDLKSIPEEHRLDAKMKVMEVIKKYTLKPSVSTL